MRHGRPSHMIGDRPRLVVLYAGDNDLTLGRTPTGRALILGLILSLPIAALLRRRGPTGPPRHIIRDVLAFLGLSGQRL